jgi:hypothetical protein
MLLGYLLNIVYLFWKILSCILDIEIKVLTFGRMIYLLRREVYSIRFFVYTTIEKYQ